MIISKQEGIHIKNSYFCLPVYEYSLFKYNTYEKIELSSDSNLSVFISTNCSLSCLRRKCLNVVHNQVAIMGWTDDSHYLIRTLIQIKILLFRVLILKPEKELLFLLLNPNGSVVQSLPQGITLTMNDVISPDKKSVVINKG